MKPLEAGILASFASIELEGIGFVFWGLFVLHAKTQGDLFYAIYSPILAVLEAYPWTKWLASIPILTLLIISMLGSLFPSLVEESTSLPEDSK